MKKLIINYIIRLLILTTIFIFLANCNLFFNAIRNRGDSINLKITNFSSDKIQISTGLDNGNLHYIDINKFFEVQKQFDGGGSASVEITTKNKVYNCFWTPYFESSLNDWNIIINVYDDKIIPEGSWNDQWNIKSN